jgi:hypothetical protein
LIEGMKAVDARLCRKALRGLAGLVPVVALVLAAFVASVGVGEAGLAHGGPGCRMEMSAGDAHVDMGHCGLSGGASECASHASCLSVTLPETQEIVVSPRATRWPLPGASDEPGTAIQLNTPPPIPAA